MSLFSEGLSPFRGFETTASRDDYPYAAKRAEEIRRKLDSKRNSEPAPKKQLIQK